jgi:hypothetical protein
MDTPVGTPKRLSRWSRDPELSESGKPKAAYVIERDIEVFKLLARFTYLPLDDIHAYVGGSEVNRGRTDSELEALIAGSTIKGTKPRVCKTCGQLGHGAKDCPQRQLPPAE